MEKLGYKKITVKNWNEPDLPSTTFCTLDKKGKIKHWTGEDWVKAIMKPKLSKKVPLEIRKLYEVTRGAVVYGYYYYPLYTLAGQQFFRILETGCAFKCKELGVDGEFRTFKKRINYLNSIGLIEDDGLEIWHANRDLRNLASHPEHQPIFPPGWILEFLNKTTNMLNSLFESKMKHPA